MAAAKIKQHRAMRDTWLQRLDEVKECAEQAETDAEIKNEFYARYQDLNVIYTEFQNNHLMLIGIISTQDGADLEAEHVIRREFDRKYYYIKTKYSKLFSKTDPVPIMNNPNVKLPKIDIPKFSGNLQEWPAFLDLYKSLIHNNGALSKTEKFRYLLSSLSKGALSCIKSLKITDNNYDTAFVTLVDRFQNPRLIASTYWQEIMDFPKLHTESATGLRSLLECFHENLDGLKNLNLPVDEWSFVLFHILVKKLDTATLKLFEMSYASSDIPTYDGLVTFLKSQCTALESVVLYSQKSHRSSYNNTKFCSSVESRDNKNDKKTFLVTNNNKTSGTCSLCNASHVIYKCPSFLNKTPTDRYRLVKQKGLCLNCLYPSHRSSECRVQDTCHVCHHKHHSLIHFSGSTSQQRSDELSSSHSSTSANAQESGTSSTANVSSNNSNVFFGSVGNNTIALLATAVVEIKDRYEMFHRVRVLLDGGSQVSLISSACANRLKLARSRLSLVVSGIGQSSLEAKYGVTFQLRSAAAAGPVVTVEAVVIQKISSHMPSSHFSVEHWSHLKNIQLADPNFNIPNGVDILLGAELIPDILRGGQIRGDCDQPMAIETIFGWVVTGKICLQPPTLKYSLFTHAQNLSLDATLKKFWELEEIPQSNCMTQDEQRCEEIFVASHHRDRSGRYIVYLPFKEGAPSFLETRSIAIRRFFCLERRLLQNKNLYSAYSSFMKDYLDNGHMSKIDSLPNDPFRVYYIPHHGVQKPDSTSTKLRVVFDASASPPGGESLNEKLLVGPKLQRDLVSILLRFRLHTFVVTADIRQMYLQIFVAPEQRDYQRIVWRFDPNGKLNEYQLNTVTFGVASSPYLAIRTLLQLAKDEGHHFPIAAKILRSDIYVDDLVTGGESLEYCKSLQKELIGLLKKGGFELRKWSSNHADLLNNFPIDFRHQPMLLFDNEDNSAIKILGLQWRPNLDAFSYNGDIIERTCSKRNILSDLARIFDPLGFLGPVTFFAKYMMQYLWTLGLQWDEEPPPDVKSRWMEFKRDLHSLSSLNIPRYILGENINNIQVHGFADASERGFAAVVYIRWSNVDGETQTSLMISKSKVAPLKRISIPRLELCAALLLADLMHFVIRTCEQNIFVQNIFAWSDSLVTLKWIRSSPHRWQTFVSNRVTKIQEQIQPSCWHHVKGIDNPADCASRGLYPTELVEHPLWWKGPLWLTNSPESWPMIEPELTNSDDLKEEMRTVSLAVSASLDSVDDLIERFSSLPKIQRIICYVLRYFNNTKIQNKRFGAFTQQELHRSLLVLVKRVQYKNFGDLIDSLTNKKVISKTFRKLSPFIDEDGFVRVGGRLVNARISYDTKHPILLPQKHRLVELLINEYHKKHFHPGAQNLRFLISENFWILNAKNAIRSVISKCIRCFRVRPNSFSPYMGNLPASRVSQVKPFSIVGVDFAGPLYITLSKARGCKSQKAYICIFVCFATRAIHLELVSDLSSDAFLAALRRFLARRGRLSVIHSDCGTNFVGADRLLREMFQQAVDMEHIEWRFNPPSSPHFGGLHEAGVKSVKGHLIRVIGEQILTFEEMYTILVQIEALLNSRPLTEMSSDPNDLQALTPGHFLTMEPLSVLPDANVTDMPINRLSRWQLLQKIHQDFWKRWHLEYLNTLVHRKKWTDHQNPLTTGKLVLIKDDLQPPMRWRLGRVQEIFCGTDGIGRVASVKTALGIIRRPIIKLCPLPTD